MILLCLFCFVVVKIADAVSMVNFCMNEICCVQTWIALIVNIYWIKLRCLVNRRRGTNSSYLNKEVKYQIKNIGTGF